MIAPSRGGTPIRDALAILSRLEQRFPENANATVFAMANPLVAVPNDQLENGIALITVKDVR